MYYTGLESFVSLGIAAWNLIDLPTLASRNPSGIALSFAAPRVWPRGSEERNGERVIGGKRKGKRNRGEGRGGGKGGGTHAEVRS